MNDLVFNPWIGEQYNQGLNGKKTFILGEAHYLNEGGGIKCKQSEFTKACIGAQTDQNLGDGEWTHPFFTKIMKVMSSNMTKKEFWDQVIFYNYIQEFIKGVRKRPDTLQWRNAACPLKYILKEYQPEVLIVLGYELWTHVSWYFEKTKVGVPEKGLKQPCLLSPKEIAGIDCDIKPSEIKPFLAIPIKHPSSVGFSTQYWKKQMSLFLNY